MPNHYGNTLICQKASDWWDESGGEPHREEVAASVAAGKLVESAVPMSDDARASAGARERGPDPLWYQWAMQNWGTKWGDYNGEFREMHADGAPPIITFNTAWSPPNESCRAKVRDWLRDRGIVVHLWIGSDPFDDSTSVVENWTGKV